MDPSIAITIGIIAIVLPFILAVLMFRPLVTSIADRIGGGKSSAKEIKDLKKKMLMLQDEVADLRGKVMGMEDDYQFAQKMLEDMENRGERKTKE
ncbi:MAG: hypothetical protein SGJ27_12645 [Candidatus Melainabacteria bacterium]|nr:hypothetical protein [Candidatus Melainabacteria bacterium]